MSVSVQFTFENIENNYKYLYNMFVKNEYKGAQKDGKKSS